MKDLTENVIGVIFSAGQWSGKKKDTALADEVKDMKNAKKAPSVYKPLAIDNELVAVSQAITEARTYHYDHTLPYEKGKFMLPLELFEDYCKKMQGFGIRISELVDALVENFDDLIAKAEAQQNGMFKRSDYPTKEKLKRLFHFDLVFEPMPPDHFFCKVVSESLKEAEAEHQARMMEVRNNALKEAFGRLNEVVSHAFDKLNDPKAVFRDSLVSNIAELVQVLPKLNITGDPTLNELTDKAARELTLYDAQTLRDDPVVRKQTADKAGEILDKMKDFI